MKRLHVHFDEEKLAERIEDSSEDSDISDDDYDDWEPGELITFNYTASCYKLEILSEEGPEMRLAAPQPNKQTSSNKVISFQPREKLFKKFSHKINVDEFKLPSVPDDDRLRVRDKQDRATAEQVMDPRTRMILFKLMNRGFISQINGCISTGKEANVYHATGKDDTQLALKIYKTSILVFKDRDKYVTGEFR